MRNEEIQPICRIGGWLLVVSVLVALLLAPAAQANHIPGATYSGPAATGGTVEFDVSADGTSVTRFAVNDVPTTCGTASGTTTGNIPITDHSFSSTSGALRFAGSFPGSQQATGTLSLRLFGSPSCTSDDVAWNATTSASPPSQPGDDTTPPPSDTTPPPSQTTPPPADNQACANAQGDVADAKAGVAKAKKGVKKAKKGVQKAEGKKAKAKAKKKVAKAKKKLAKKKDKLQAAKSEQEEACT